MSVDQELRPHQEADGRTEVYRRGTSGRWGEVHSLLQPTLDTVQPQQFQHQSPQPWQPEAVKLSLYKPLYSQVSRKITPGGHEVGSRGPLDQLRRLLEDLMCARFMG